MIGRFSLRGGDTFKCPGGESGVCLITAVDSAERTILATTGTPPEFVSRRWLVAKFVERFGRWEYVPREDREIRRV